MTLENRKPLFAVTFFLIIIGFCPVTAAPLDIQKDMNEFYVKMNNSFSQIASSAQLRSTRLKKAEKLFVKILKNDRTYFTLLRTNSKGTVISEVIRGQKVERPNRDISSQSWFQQVKLNNEDYYSLIKDNDRGRYYLFWCKPIIRGNSFVGSVVAKIDLWDSFYEFSNSVYYPFLIKLRDFSLFSHKWRDDITFDKKNLTIPGIDDISVFYIPEKKKGAILPVKDTITEAVATPVNQTDDQNKKSSFPLSILITIFLILAVAVVIFLIKRKKNWERILFDMIDKQ